MAFGIFDAANLLAAIAILSTNTVIIIAAHKKQSLDKPSYKLILGLTTADWMTGAFMLFEMAYRYIFNEYGAKDTYSKFYFGCMVGILPLFAISFTSNILQMIIALERYFAVSKPIQHRNLLTRKVAKGIVFAVFAVSAILGTMPLYWNNFPSRNHKSCTILAFSLSFCSYVILPLYLVALACTVFINIQIVRVSATKINHNVKALKTIGIILSCYCLCWLPQLVCMTILLHDALPGKLGKDQYFVNRGLEYIYHWLLLLAFCNSVINPVIYSWRMPDFQNAVKETIFRKKYETGVNEGADAENECL